MDDNVHRYLAVGIFGPSDCDKEMQRAEWVLLKDRTVLRIARDSRIAIEPVHWSQVTSGIGRAQDRIDELVDETDPPLRLFVFKDNFGSDAGLGMSGTEEELERAFARVEARDRLCDIGIYFGQPEPTDARVTALRNRLEEKNFLYERFADVVDFERKVRDKVIEFIRNYAVASVGRTRPTLADILRAFAASPLSLRTYPRTLPDGRELPRPELDALVEKIRTAPSSVTILIGERGSGKSALLSALDERLRNHTIAVLSIKSDRIAPTVTTAATLAADLCLPEDLIACVQRVAQHQLVAILIDQVDALADILDRRSERLNVLLDAIHNLSGLPNVHLVVSSRPFELRHDARLRTLEADELDLELPAWSSVAAVLDRHGFATEAIAEDVRELLRNPWTLSTFLDLHPKDVSFASLFALLGELWERTVTASEAPAGTNELLDLMVRTMSDEEVLWVPAAIASECPAARDYLIKSELILRDDSGHQIGFRHQSFYELALSRQFVSGSQSLAEYVLDHASGLFVRPIALAGLAYLRASSPKRYESELATLWTASPRAHLRALMIEFVAAQGDPLVTEIAIIKELLRDDRDGPRALSAVAPYSQWFAILSKYEPFLRWLRRRPEEARHSVGLLVSGATASDDEVLDLVEREWLPDTKYDALAFTVVSNLGTWSERVLEIALHVVRRTSLDGVYDVAQQLIGTRPDAAARVIRAHLEGAVEAIRAKGDGYERTVALKTLFDREDYTNVYADLAETAPDVLVAWLLPFVVEAIEASAPTADVRFQEYRHGGIEVAPFANLPLPALIEATTEALRKIAATDVQKALVVIEPLLASDVVGVHALAAYVLERAEPRIVLEYLLRDPRHLAIGSLQQHHMFTKTLVQAIVPRLEPAEVRQLEAAILAYDFLVAPDETMTEEQLARKAPLNREHRLFLLQSIPDQFLSDEARRAKRAFDTEFSGLEESVFGRITSGTSEAPYDLAELTALSDDQIAAVFDELTDETGWDHPRRWSAEGDRLLGGSIEQSRVLSELAQKHPDRGFAIARMFRPSIQERPAGAIVEGLAKANADQDALLALILDLAARGFSSDEFATSTADALANVSARRKGLPNGVIAMLDVWLDHLETPTPKDTHDESDKVPTHSLIFSAGGMFMQPHGRGPVISAIAAGYLEREPPELAEWIDVVRRRIDAESHRGVWVMTMQKLHAVLVDDAATATELFDAILKRHSDVLREPFAWHMIAMWMRAFVPSEAVLDWIDVMRGIDAPQPRQAAGELLYLYFAHHRDTTSHDRILELSLSGDRDIVRGIAFAAANLWDSIRTREVGAEVLVNEIDRWPDDAVKTLPSLRIEDLDDLTQRVFLAAAKNLAVLLPIFSGLGEQIEPMTADEPTFVAAIAKAVVDAPTTQVENVLGYRAAEVMTSIALTLHRIPGYETVGLDLFEKLLDANLREARAALEVLDRKPTRQIWRRPRRPRRPRRVK
jgi:hypothetical protein